MPKMLVDEGVEYEDGTPATESQQAKVSRQETDALLCLELPRGLMEPTDAIVEAEESVASSCAAPVAAGLGFSCRISLFEGIPHGITDTFVIHRRRMS